MEKEIKNLKVFGYGLAIIFMVFVFKLSKENSGAMIQICLMGAALGFTLITLWNVNGLKPIYKYWMIGAHFIGTVITTLILTILYYGVFSLFGMFFRLIGKDYLDRSIDKSVRSYWSKRETQDFDPAQYSKQF